MSEHIIMNILQSDKIAKFQIMQLNHWIYSPPELPMLALGISIKCEKK